MIGERLGNWVLQSEIGQGGMGRVYLAREDAPAARTAAVKVLTAALAADAGFLVRFQREAEILRRLHHPNVVSYYDDGAHRGHAWIAMEYVEGPTCEDVLQRRGRLPWQEVLEIALQVSLALKHAHDHGVIHRDLKPSNLLLGGIRGPAGAPVEGAVYAVVSDPSAPPFVVKLTDFGIATAFAATPLTVPGAVVGTAEYLSPEQAAGKPVTKRSDLYSLGAVLYTLLTGRTPFQGKSPVELLHKHQFGQFDRPTRLVPDTPHDLDEIICQLLEKDPAKRPADAGVLHRQLDRVRRKLERRAGEATDEAVGHAETQVGEGGKPRKRGPGPATLVSRFVREELESQNRGGPLQQFFNRPAVLLTLLLLCVAVIVWAFWPPSADGLFQRGQAAMAKEPPEWESADETFALLDQRFPEHPHREAVEEYRKQIQELRAERATPWYRVRSEVQTLYEEGLRLRQRGDEAAARRVWLNLVNAFRDVEAEKKWVGLAEAELAKPSKRAQAGEMRWAPVREALARARELRDQGRALAAEEIWKGLEELYGSDPSAAEVLEDLRKDRAKKP